MRQAALTLQLSLEPRLFLLLDDKGEVIGGVFAKTMRVAREVGKKEEGVVFVRQYAPAPWLEDIKRHTLTTDGE